MKKPEAGMNGKSKGKATCSDVGFAKQHARITEYLVEVRWDDGTPREPSALSITVRDGLIAVALNDKDLGQSLYSQDETLTGALQLLEGALKEGTGQWRTWKVGKKKGGG